MTVCIAAVCDHGRNVVCAVDGMLSHIVSADVHAKKMILLGDWVFMFAGTLGNADLMMDCVRPEQFTAKDIKSVVRQAYRKRLAQWSADRFLFQYDMDMSEFKKEGRNILGDERFAELSRTIEQDASNYRETVLVVGWGKSDRMPIVFDVSRDGIASHSLDGLATIGSGAEVAMSTLLVLDQHREMTLEDTIYSVAAAKFSAERCDGVGKSTTMFVSWKRADGDDSQGGAGKFVDPPEIDQLRKVWERHGRPRVPEQSWDVSSTIANRLFQNRQRPVEFEHIERTMRSISRKSKRGK